MTAVLSLTDLNRATLARQMLLAREPATPLAAVGHLFGLQAQVPRPPFVSLWSRLPARGDDGGAWIRDALGGLLHGRVLVRATSMRGTLHVMRAEDYRRFRHTLQAGIDAGVKMLGARLAGVDLGRLVEEGRRFFATPRPFDAFRAHLAARHAGADVRAMAYAVRTQVPLVQVPAALPWAYPATPEFIDAEAWIGALPPPADRTDALVQRYLAALGPATAADVQAWCGLPGARAALARLRPTLSVLAGEGRAELFDLPEAPRPPADTAVPVRFLPEWDSAIVSRADARLVAKAHRPAIFRPGLRVLPTVLVDGFVGGTWRIDRKKATATVAVELFRPAPRPLRAEIEREGEALARFLEPDAGEAGVRIG